MNKKKHIGSSFESFLTSEGIFEEINVAAIKASIAQSLKDYMTKMHMTQTEMAKQLKTSRSGLQRLLDPDNYSVTLLTLNRAASLLGKRVTMDLVTITENNKSARK